VALEALVWYNVSGSLLQRSEEAKGDREASACLGRFAITMNPDGNGRTGSI